jgi:hypothetical protein
MFRDLFGRKKNKESRPSQPKDELCGKWTTDDGTGFIVMMGSWMEIRPDGTGSYESWAGSDDDTGYEFKGNFTWRRLGPDTICIQKKGADKEEWIKYKIEYVNGREELTSEQKQMGSVLLKGFWDFAQVVFRVK